MTDQPSRPLSRPEWTGTLLGLGLVIGAAILLEEAPRGDYGQIALILGAAVGVSVACMAAVCTFSRKGRARSVPLEQEVNAHGYGRI